MSDVETVERFIPAPPEAIFAIVANPRRHHEIDGSGTVRDAKDVPDEIHLGSRFGMSMKLGIPYSMVSEVVEYEPNRLIAWQTSPPSGWASALAAVGSGATNSNPRGRHARAGKLGHHPRTFEGDRAPRTQANAQGHDRNARTHRADRHRAVTRRKRSNHAPGASVSSARR